MDLPKRIHDGRMGIQRTAIGQRQLHRLSTSILVYEEGASPRDNPATADTMQAQSQPVN